MQREAEVSQVLFESSAVKLYRLARGEGGGGGGGVGGGGVGGGGEGGGGAGDGGSSGGGGDGGGSSMTQLPSSSVAKESKLLALGAGQPGRA